MNELFLTVVDRSMLAGWIILIVAVLRLVLKKAPKWIRMLLWGIVAFRLICPFSIQSMLSLVPAGETFPLQIPSGLELQVQAGTAAAEEQVPESLGENAFINVSASSGHRERIVTILRSLWCFGAMLFLGYAFLGYRKLQRKVCTAVRLRDNLFQSEYVTSPFVFGILHPKIYLPFGMEEPHLRYVCAHEEAHIRRRDHWWKLLGFMLLAVYWFHPLIHLGYALFCRDMELSCDEKVLKELGTGCKAEYSRALLLCSVGSRIAGCPVAFGEIGVKKRVKNILNYKKPAFWVIVVSVLVCILAAVCLLTDPVSENTGSPSGEMIPTNAKLEGIFDTYLYLSIDGENYRFERTEADTNEIKRDRLLERFTEEADPKDVHWEIYSVKGCSDCSVVLGVTNTDYECLYEYSPPRRVELEELQRVKEEGYVTMEDGTVTSGKEIWEAFAAKARQGNDASVKIAEFYTLDPESCSEAYYEANKEDYPSLYLFELTGSDGNGYTICWKEGERSYQEEYQYLMYYTGDAPTSDAVYDSYVRYVLTDDDTVTWDDLVWGLLSSRSGDGIRHFTVYTELF
ncbi:MAG: M56 family metallopeptidase [Fusicatenibacter sp.]